MTLVHIENAQVGHRFVDYFNAGQRHVFIVVAVRGLDGTRLAVDDV